MRPNTPSATEVGGVTALAPATDSVPRAQDWDQSLGLLGVSVLTSMNDAQTRVRAIEAGASQIIYKPLTGKNFLQSVQVLLEGGQDGLDGVMTLRDE